MKTARFTALSGVLALSITAAAIAQEDVQPSPNEKGSNTRTASCLVKVTSDPAVMPLSFEIIEHLLHSSGVAGGAAAAWLGLSPDESGDLFSIEPLAGDLTKPPKALRSRTRGLQQPPEPEDKVDRPTYEPPAAGPIEPARRPEAPPGLRGAERDTLPRERPSRTYGGYGGHGRYGYGYGGYGYGGYTPPGPAPRISAETGEQTFLFRLKVELDKELRPVAEEVMVEIINNLRETLEHAFYEHKSKLEAEIDYTDDEFRRAERELANAAAGGGPCTLADHELRNKLDDEVVDLSSVTPEMTFADAIEQFKHSFEPPLPIVVHWRDIEDNAAIDRTTPVNMDPMPAIGLGKALELLLKSVSGEPDKLGYKVEKAMIIIASARSLPQYYLQVPQPQVSMELFVENRQQLIREKQHLEMTIVRNRARERAILDQLEVITDRIGRELHRDPIAEQLRAIIDLHAERLDRMPEASVAGDEKRLSPEQVRRFADQLADEKATVAENLAKAKIELARRREDLSRSAGGERLDDLNRDLAEIAINLAENEAALKLINQRLPKIEAHLKEAARFDPQASQIRFAQEALEAAGHNLNTLKIRLAQLHRPSVTILGAD